MGAGRPLKFETPEDIESRGWDYIEKTGVMSTVTGLARALGTTRQTLCDYQKRPEFTDAIKRLKHECEHFMVQRALTEKNQAANIFLLKANYGYIETSRVETDQTHRLAFDGLTEDQLDALDAELADRPDQT